MLPGGGVGGFRERPSGANVLSKLHVYTTKCHEVYRPVPSASSWLWPSLSFTDDFRGSSLVV